MINVFFLETSLGMGGSEMMWAQLIRNLDRTRFRPVVCCLYDRGQIGHELAQEGIILHEWLSRGRFDVSVFFKLNRLLKREHADILYVINQALVQFWATGCCCVAGVPVLITSIHNMGQFKRVRRKRWINRLTFGFVDCVTALSQSHRDYLIQNEPIAADKVEIIPNGIEIEKFSYLSDGETRKSLGIPGKASIVGILAMLRPEKAHDIFLKAAALVLKRVPSVCFLIIGDGPERSRLVELTRTLSIQKNVQFLGMRNDVNKLLAVLDVAVLCSYSVVETLSIAVLEYMACSKPVVATRVGSLSELVEDNVSGYLVNSGDYHSLANRILALLEDSNLARRMGAEGRRRVISRYTMENMVAAHEKLFEKLLQKKDAQR